MSILSNLGKAIGTRFSQVNSEIQRDKDRIKKLESDIIDFKTQLLKIQHETSQSIYDKDLRFTSPNNGVILLDEDLNQYRIRINDKKLIIDNLNYNEIHVAEINFNLPTTQSSPPQPTSITNLNSMIFDGSDTVFNLGSSLEGTGSQSVSFWIKRDSESQSNDGGILTIVPNESTSDYISIALWEDTIQSSVTNTSNIKGSTTLSLDTWYHIIVIKDGTPSTTAIYVNGKEETLSTDGTWVGNIDTPQAKIGEISYNGVNYNFTGLIDEVAIFDSALEVSTIETIYSGSLPLGTSQSLDLNTLPTPPSSWYRMGD
jgi:hypothetical protein